MPAADKAAQKFAHWPIRAHKLFIASSVPAAGRPARDATCYTVVPNVVMAGRVPAMTTTGNPSGSFIGRSAATRQ